MSQSWYEKGQLGYGSPREDQDPYGWKELEYQAGRAQRRLDREIAYIVNHPEDPHRDKDPYKTW